MIEETERLRRWRLVLGGESAEAGDPALGGTDLGMDRVLEALYDNERSGGLGLTIVRTLVAGELGGRMDMRTDGGTLVELTIPLTQSGRR